MSRQFDLTKLSNGNLLVSGGNVREQKGTTRIYVADGATDTTPGAMVVPVGGSGRNVRITGLVGLAVTADVFEAIGKLDFKGRLLPDWSLTYGTDGSVELSDGTDIVATAAAGTVPIGGRVVCSASANAGGDGGGEYTVDLGTATGTVELAFEALSVPDRFIVEWDGSEVINSGLRGVDGTYDGQVVVVDGAGSGTLSFNKTTASPTTAIVRVISPYSGTSWSFTLGCPGGGSPPYPISSLADWGSYDLTATTYGQDTYNSSAAFTLTARVEKAIITMLGAEVLPLAGTGFSGSMRWTQVGGWEGITDDTWTVAIAGDGTATISDAVDVVATRPVGPLHDPSGYYTATTYGATTYNAGVVFGTHVSESLGGAIQNSIYLLVTESAPGVIATASGPHLAAALPSAASPIFPFELGQINSSGELIPIQDGTVVWADSGVWLPAWATAFDRVEIVSDDEIEFEQGGVVFYAPLFRRSGSGGTFPLPLRVFNRLEFVTDDELEIEAGGIVFYTTFFRRP